MNLTVASLTSDLNTEDRNRVLTYLDVTREVRFVIQHCQSKTKHFSRVWHEIIIGTVCFLL